MKNALKEFRAFAAPTNVIEFLKPNLGVPKVKKDYRVVAAKGDDPAEIFLYGVIGGDWFGDGITANQFKDDLKALGKVKRIALHINSPGGDVHDGRAIYNMLAQHEAAIDVTVDAEAASAASLIAMAGNTITMAEGSLMMIHCAWGLTVGNVQDHQRNMDLLRKVDDLQIETYARRSKNSREKVHQMLMDETWMTADEAVKLGFADQVSEPMKMAALAVDRTRFGFRHVPQNLRPRRAAALAILDKIRA